MKLFLIVVSCVLYQSVTGSGYVYGPNKVQQSPGYHYDKPNLQRPQSDFTIEDLVSQQKQNIFQSFGSNNKVGFSKGNKCETCTCGIPNANRIIGGQRVTYNKYPWIAQLSLNGRFFCGGALINNKYILTAAHCVQGMAWQKITVRLLQHDRSTYAVGITKRVVSAIVHRGYSQTTLANDIALLKLDSAIPLTDSIKPVCLPSSAFANYDYLSAIVAGWGLTSEYGQTSQSLQEVSVPIITNAQCRRTQYKTMILDTMLCAGNVQAGGKDACQGDSGGPLMVHQSPAYTLVGVVSFGYGCAKPNAPGVYTRLTKYLDWVYENTKDACYCRN